MKKRIVNSERRRQFVYECVSEVVMLERIAAQRKGDFLNVKDTDNLLSRIQNNAAHVAAEAFAANCQQQAIPFVHDLIAARKPTS